jgi:hypothetical protein
VQDPHFVNKLLGKNFQVMQVHEKAFDATVSGLAVLYMVEPFYLYCAVACLQRMGKPVLMPFLQVCC